MMDLRERLAKQIRKELGIHDNSEEPVVFLVRDLATLASHQQAEIDRLTQIEAAAKAIYFAGHWVRNNSSSEAEDTPLWDALKESTGWSLTGGVSNE
jgi:hypothetical protein